MGGVRPRHRGTVASQASEASGYLKAAGLVVQGRGRPRTRPSKPAISVEVSTDSSAALAAGPGRGTATAVARDRPGRAPRASACEPYRELVVAALGRGADRHGHLAGPGR